MVLNYPFRSQEDADARRYRNDCGTACVAMYLQFWKRWSGTIDELSAETALAVSDVGLTSAQVAALLVRHGEAARVARGVTVDTLRAETNAGRPVIALISYAEIKERQNQPDRGGHFVLVIGADSKSVIVHDPDWWGANRDRGMFLKLPADEFALALAHSPAPNTGILMGDQALPTFNTVEELKAVLVTTATDAGVNVQASGHAALMMRASDMQKLAGVVVAPPIPHVVPIGPAHVSSDSMNVRGSPAGNVLATLKRGDQVEILDAPPVVALLGGVEYHWVRINVQSGGYTNVYAAEGLLAPGAAIVPNTYKAGVHIHMNAPGQQIIDMARSLKAVNKPLSLAVVLNDPGLCNALGALSVFVITRRQDGIEDINPQIPDGISEADAIALGARYVRDRWNYIYADATSASALQFQNEPAFHPMDYAVAIGIMQECERRGRKAAVFCDGVGRPEGDDWENKWRMRIPAMRYAAAHGHFCLYHAYGSSVAPDSGASDPGGTEWFSLRHRKVYAMMPADARPKLVFGETGTFNARFLSADFLVNDMRGFEKLLQADPYASLIVGFAYWTLGARNDPKFGQSCADDALPDIRQFLLTR